MKHQAEKTKSQHQTPMTDNHTRGVSPGLYAQTGTRAGAGETAAPPMTKEDWIHYCETSGTCFQDD